MYVVGTMSKRVEHRKPQAERRGTALKIRLTDGEKRRIEAAARREHDDVSSWLRRVAMRAARRRAP